jgi:hypothetical protein
VCAAGQDRQQSPLALEQHAQDLRHREHDMAVRHWGENVFGHALREQHGALGLTAGAEVSGLAGKGQKMFAPA